VDQRARLPRTNDEVPVLKHLKSFVITAEPLPERSPIERASGIDEVAHDQAFEPEGNRDLLAANLAAIGSICDVTHPRISIVGARGLEA